MFGTWEEKCTCVVGWGGSHKRKCFRQRTVGDIQKDRYLRQEKRSENKIQVIVLYTAKA